MFQTSFRNLPTIGNAEIGRGSMRRRRIRKQRVIIPESAKAKKLRMSLSKALSDEEKRKELFTVVALASAAPKDKVARKAYTVMAAKTLQTALPTKYAPVAKPVVAPVVAPRLPYAPVGAPVVEAVAISEPTAKPFNMKTLLIPGGIVAALLIATQIKKK
ncbi:MAG: hypothetical protein AB1478_01720 [Nitrospirota bacterium]